MQTEGFPGSDRTQTDRQTDARTHARALMSERPRTRAGGQTDVWFENDEAATKLPALTFSTQEADV